MRGGSSCARSPRAKFPKFAPAAFRSRSWRPRRCAIRGPTESFGSCTRNAFELFPLDRAASLWPTRRRRCPSALGVVVRSPRARPRCRSLRWRTIFGSVGCRRHCGVSPTVRSFFCQSRGASCGVTIARQIRVRMLLPMSASRRSWGILLRFRRRMAVRKSYRFRLGSPTSWSLCRLSSRVPIQRT